ncbi:MAG TPA: glycosyltransferase family 1 protein [Chloroflexi bacterium]|nr:glycosyltransferase family 1 protein [Chloroflexota bacterium]
MTPPERIAFDARYINDRYHGIGRYAFRLLEAMVAAAPERTFIVFRGRGQDSRFDWSGLAARPNVELREGPWPLYWPHEQLLWPLLLRRSRADLFHTPYFAAPLLAPCPVVVTVHDLIFDRYPAYMPWGWARPYYRLLMAWGTRRAKRVIAVSQATAADLTHFYGTPPERIAVVPEGVDPGFAPPSDPDRRRALRWRYGLLRPFVLTVGARRPHKNLGRLVRAFSRVAVEVPHDLVFVGEADPRFPDEARQAVIEEGIGHRVRFLGWVAEADLPGLYSLADLVVLPSLVEGFGLPALEAMACGTPVLAAATSSLPEVVGEAGVLVDPHDVSAMAGALRGLLHDEALRCRLSEMGRQRAATFTWAATAQRTLEVYEEASAADAFGAPEPLRQTEGSR